MSRYSYKREGDKTQRNLLGGIVNGIILLVSIVATIALLLTLISPIINPSVNWIFPVLGLFAPAIYVTNLILALYWIINWKWLYAIPMVVLLLFGVSSISLFVNMEVKKDYGVESYKNMPKVMSYNIRRFINDDRQWSTKAIAEYIESQDPDIICLQEYVQNAKGLSTEFKATLKDYKRAEFNTLAIYSKYPIIKKEDIFARDTNEMRRSMWADIVIKNDTIRLFNNHLHSTTIKAEDNEYLTSKLLVKDTLRRDKIKDMLVRFSHGSVERNKQVDTIAQVIAQSPYEVVVCGDFNDTPISHAYNVMSHGLKDSFQECGKGFSYTYRGFYNILRIDYILVSDQITPHNYFVDEECELSDHLPIMANIEIH